MRHVGPRLVCAATYHRRALCRFPLLRHGALHSNFALARLARGDRAGAIRQLMIAVEVDIENKEAWFLAKMDATLKRWPPLCAGGAARLSTPCFATAKELHLSILARLITIAPPPIF